jgi:hypothetical protein
VPAGYVQTAYDAHYVLAKDCQSYIGQTTAEPTSLAEPGLPFSLVFRVEPGMEDSLIRIASAYEAASKRRVSPPQFGLIS